MSEVDKDYRFYIDNYDDLVSRYDGKVLIIVGQSVKGVYSSLDDAYDHAVRTYGGGNFMMQECSSKSRGYEIRTSVLPKIDKNDIAQWKDSFKV